MEHFLTRTYILNRVKNIIAFTEQCSQRSSAADVTKSVCMCEKGLILLPHVNVISWKLDPFPSYWRFLILQQTIFENIVEQWETVYNEQFLSLSQCFELYSIIVLSFIESFYIFDLCFQVVCCRFVFSMWERMNSCYNH